MDVRVLFWLPFFIAGASIFGVAVYAWFRRSIAGAILLIPLCLCSSWWSVFEGLLYFGLDAETNLLITKLQYVGMVWVAPLTLLFVMNLFAKRTWNRPRYYLPLFLASAAVLVLAWTNDLHGLIWPSYWTIETRPFPMLGLTHGPLFWVSILYYYLCLGAATIILVHQAVTAAPVFRVQARVILAGLSVTWLGNAVYISGLSPIPNLDPGPLAFVITTGIMSWGFFRHQLLDVAPVAMTEVFNSLDDAVLVLDLKGRVIDINPAAEAVVGRRRDGLVGLTTQEAFQDQPWLRQIFDDKDLKNVELCLVSANAPQTYDLRISVLTDRRGQALGRLLVWRDITARKQLELELQRLATIDSLTGAFNRTSFMERASAELTRSRRYNKALSLLMLDLDQFKKINDTFGHQAGDRALQAFGAVIRADLRQSDFFGRLGGEEFAVLLCETDRAAAVRAAERLRLAVAGLVLTTDRGPLKFTVSIGLTNLTEGDTELNPLLSRADQALYRAKAAGRNRVMADGTE
ncbi:MAG: histidine kinase N-terminal 7TM domain-containing protein [Thermodesulfobacteriota bacterium]